MLQREEVEIIGHLRIEYTTHYEEDTYMVEGHGYHVMTDITDKFRKIDAVYICVEDYMLEITNKITKKELNELEEYLSSL